ncbi:MAG: hypothetical protein WAT79_11200 [Saprospiraceae bacterium]
MKRIFLLNGIIECLVGLIFIVRPETLFIGGAIETKALFITKMFGMLAMSFGGLSLVIARHGNEEKLYQFSALIIIVYHLLIAFQSYGVFVGGMLPNLGPFYLHLVLALLFVILYLKNKK